MIVFGLGMAAIRVVMMIKYEVAFVLMLMIILKIAMIMMIKKLTPVAYILFLQNQNLCYSSNNIHL